MATQQHELHERIERVASAAADRDVLVTLAIPPDEDLEEVRRRIESDHAGAEYAESDPVPEPLQDALEEQRRTLADYDETPPNGLVVYAGTPDGDLETHVFDDLPDPVSEWTYEVANEFDESPLETVTEPPRTDGLLIVERGGAALGLLEGERVEPVSTVDSDVPGKSSAGGQSAERFERERERQKRAFFDEVGDEAKRLFLDDRDVDALFLGGTSVTVDNFRNGDYLDHRLEDRVEGGTFAVEYASEQGLEQLAERVAADRERAARRDTRDVLERFFDALATDEPVAYGRDEVEEALAYDAVETALLSEAVPGSDVRELGDRATDAGGDVVVIPDDFADGERFAEAFGGVGALLRFPID